MCEVAELELDECSPLKANIFSSITGGHDQECMILDQAAQAELRRNAAEDEARLLKIFASGFLPRTSMPFTLRATTCTQPPTMFTQSPVTFTCTTMTFT